jgi:pimeloyl-ACP methyl ester carboxylesterase
MALLSSNGKHKLVQAGHNLQVEDPAVVVQAIRDVVMAVRR